jgi:hypothetical protein
MWKSQVLSVARCSKRSSAPITASHVSWTTSSAIASVLTYARATRLRLAW